VEGDLFVMSCGGDTVPASDGDKIKVVTGACCAHACPPGNVTVTCDAVDVTKCKCGYNHAGSYIDGGTTHCFATNGTNDCTPCVGAHCQLSDEVDCNAIFRTQTVNFKNCVCCHGGEGCDTSPGGLNCVSPMGCGPDASAGCQACLADWNASVTFSFPAGAEDEACAPYNCPLEFSYLFYTNYFTQFDPPLCGMVNTVSCSGADCPGYTGNALALWIFDRCLGCFCATSQMQVSDEYTTAELVDLVYANIPEYDGVYDNHPCQAIYHMAPGEGCLRVRRIKPRFLFDPDDGARTLTYNTYFRPELDGASTLVDSFSVDVPSGADYVDGEEILEPATNGTVTIGDLVLRCADAGTQCMSVTATLSGSLKQSEACSPCYGYADACTIPVSATAVPLHSTSECCPGPPLAFCSWGKYYSYACNCDYCHFDGHYQCSSLRCVGLTTLAYINSDVPDENKCVGGGKCVCQDTPQDFWSQEGFQVEVGLHHIETASDETICFDATGWWVSIWVAVQKTNCMADTIHVFDDAVMIYHLGGDPAGTTQTFTFDENDATEGTPGCGLEDLTYSVEVTFP
jgi:hypothetical protein